MLHQVTKKPVPHRDGPNPRYHPICRQRHGRRKTATLAGHHHVPSLLTGNEPGLNLMAADFGWRFSAGNSGVILGGISASVSTVPDSLERLRPAYSSPSTFFAENFITVQTRASITSIRAVDGIMSIRCRFWPGGQEAGFNPVLRANPERRRGSSWFPGRAVPCGSRRLCHP